MSYTEEEVLQYVSEEDVKFIRLAFCDIFGTQKNISIMPGELERAFRCGIAFDSSAIAGFGGEIRSDLLLFPDPSTLALLPWRPDHGRVVRMFCKIRTPSGEGFPCDARSLLKQAAAHASACGLTFFFGTEYEFYLFKTDEAGEPTHLPFDRASYMDIAPEDRGENVRREICLTLEQMGVIPESSHHEEGPGQNEIDFRYTDALSAADHAVTFLSVVRTIAAKNGLYADFSPKPLPEHPGNGLHVNFSVSEKELLPYAIAGILRRSAEMTAFFCPTEDSYLRLGTAKAPKYVSWSPENRSQLIRIPASPKELPRAELRSPDPGANPYLAFALLIEAALEGIREKLPLPAPCEQNLYQSDFMLPLLPCSYAEAHTLSAESAFLRSVLPAPLRKAFLSL